VTARDAFGFPNTIDDEISDVDAVAGGAWVPGLYGAGDPLGSDNEVTPEKRVAPLAMLADASNVQTINLGDSQSMGGWAEESERYSSLVDAKLPKAVFNLTTPTDFRGVRLLLEYAESEGARIDRGVVGMVIENDLLD
jgi:hypothetical protein